MRFTGCIKNQFGCIPGLLKAEFHVKCPSAYDFAKMLVDLNTCIKPRLYIMDAVFAMEGNGPRSGNPRKMQVILLSEDPVACDATACRLINCDPLIVPTTTIGREFGAGVYETDKIELVGDNFDELKIPDFVIERSKVSAYKMRGLANIIGNMVVPKPTIKKNKCIHCGLCLEMCPVNPKALYWVNGDTSKPPAHNYHRCIRCDCCQEICPEKAIYLKKPLLRRFF
jgi:Pyruvate/2-oxoacid:ferredoxin oxidoreductase delta subunit